MYIIYDFLSILFLLFFFPYYLYKMWREGKYRAGFKQRFGCYPSRLRKELSTGKWIWVHAVSLGEVNAVGPLLREIRRQAPDYKIAISTITDTGQEQAKKLGLADAVFYLPLDVWLLIQMFLRFFKPSILAIAETEIWPRLIYEVHRAGIPVVLVNGRISDRSFPRYRRVAFLTRRLLRKMDLIGVQSAKDEKRVKALGAPEEKTVVFGNLKFDAVRVGSDHRESLKDIRKSFGLDGTERVVVGGSTWPGEEEILVKGYIRWIEKDPSVRLLIAPRHTNRIPEIARMLKESGLSWKRRSIPGISGYDKSERPPVLILDTHGELGRVYGLAWVVFVGKSLTEHGGQNPLEPAAAGRPVLFGPNMENFPEISEQLIMENAAGMVGNPEELIRTVEDGLSDAEPLTKMGKNAQDFVRSRQGVAEKTARALLDMIAAKEKA